jgi:hypothetical protein
MSQQQVIEIDGVSRLGRLGGWLRGALPALVSVTCIGLLVAALWDRLPAVGGALGRVHVAALGLALGLYLLSLYVLAARLGVVFGVFGTREQSARYLLYTLIGLFFSNFLPTGVGGDVVKASYAAGRTDALLEAFLATFADRVVGLLSLVLAGTIALGAYPVVEARGWTTWLALGGALLLGALVLGCRSEQWVQRGRGVVTHLPLSDRLRLLRLADALLTLLRAPGRLFQAVLLTLLALVCSALCLWVIARGMGLEIGYPVFLLVIPVITVAAVVPSINGIGVREASMVVVLRGLVPEEQALALALLFYGVVMACSILGGVVFVLRRPLGLRVHPALAARVLRQ